MKINEIFTSIEGEGIRIGAVANFVRLAGCNLRCSWCDTGYALGKDAGQEMSIEEVIAKLRETRIDRVTVTGGEPLSTAEGRRLVRELLRDGFDVNLETNGSFSALELMQYAEKTDGSLLVTMDWKLPSSGMEDRMNIEYANELSSSDVLKFVVQDEFDLRRARDIVGALTSSPYVYLSPVWGKMSMERLVEAAKSWDVPLDVRVQIQLHKVIWGAERRGV